MTQSNSICVTLPTYGLDVMSEGGVMSAALQLSLQTNDVH